LALILTHGLHESVGGDATAGGSEDMMHGPIDALIKSPLRAINHYVGGKLPIEIDRNRTDEYVL
jgi:hypothetical protein